MLALAALMAVAAIVGLHIAEHRRRQRELAEAEWDALTDWAEWDWPIPDDVTDWDFPER